MRGVKLGTKAVNAIDNTADTVRAIDRTHDYAKTIDKAWDVTKLDDAADSGKLYRGLAKGENPAKGIRARYPGAGNSPVSHVRGERRTQWISTTKNLDVATGRYGGHGTIEIDVSKVSSQMVDLSKGVPGAPSKVSKWAIRDAEVLIKDFIPPEAIRVIR